MRFSTLTVLHKKVVHGHLEHSKYCRDYDAKHENALHAKYFPRKCEVCAEEKEIKKVPYNILDAICQECFINPDSFVKPEALVILSK